MKRVTTIFFFLVGLAALSRILTMKPTKPGTGLIDNIFQLFGNLFQNTIKG